MIYQAPISNVESICWAIREGFRAAVCQMLIPDYSLIQTILTGLYCVMILCMPLRKYLPRLVMKSHHLGK